MQNCKLITEGSGSIVAVELKCIARSLLLSCVALEAHLFSSIAYIAQHPSEHGGKATEL
jgi:hypothetical protein